MPGSFFPSAMRVAPELPPVAPGPRRERLALLVNPFYPKDPHASFGKHVLTPTLVLTSAPADYGRRVRVLHDGIQVNGSFVLGFDHDGPDVFARSVDWIESNRLECATFQILTPYPRTPLFRRMEAEGRLLHRDWSLYDTAHASIWRRRPTDPRAVPAYLAMSYLYKRSNRVWHALIRRRLTARVWLPLIELSRRRHLKFRQRLAGTPAAGGRATQVVSAGV